MLADDLLAVLGEAADAVAAAVGERSDWSAPGTRLGQYGIDLVADEAVLSVLSRAGLDVLSEESGVTLAGGGLLAVVDPIDGSTNAARGIPWYATSVCVLDDEGPLCALVVNQPQHIRYEAVRGGGARRDGVPITPSGVAGLAASVVGVSGMSPSPLGWRQFRCFGAAALDLCAVADGGLDAFCDFSGALGPWDYLGGMLVCSEAGATVRDAEGRPLVSREHTDRRGVLAAGTTALVEALLAARSEAMAEGTR